MDFPIYERIWERSIKPKIDRMLAADSNNFFVERQVKERIWRTYEEYKNAVHSYMHNPDGRIDRHKVASVMLYSVIVNKPFEVRLLSEKEEVNVSSLLANEILGFHTALAIVLSFLLEDANERSDRNKIEIFKNSFVYPKCQHDSYAANVYKMLYYSKLNGCYDIFAFSHVLFFIEAYTELSRKTQLVEKVLK